MRFSSAVSVIFALPAAMAAAVAPASASLEQAAQEHEMEKSVPREDVQGLSNQLYSIGSNTVLLVSQVSQTGSSKFTYGWGQAKLCLSNNYYIAQNTHVSMSEAGWVVSYILNSCGAGIGSATCHGDTGLAIEARVIHKDDDC